MTHFVYPIMALALIALPAAALEPPRPMAAKLAPYVTSPQPVVDQMLKLAGLKTGETIYDLGCGDGRILFSAVKNFNAKAVGVELSETLVRRTRDQSEALGLTGQVKVIQGDMMQVDLKDADVVALYLITEANDQLRPKFEKELKAGARVVSLEFKMRGWKPSKVEKVEAHRHPYTIYVYEMPQKQ
jgi:SAM-dependent methyltransferase